MNTPAPLVNTPMRRLEDADDLQLPDMLSVAFVRRESLSRLLREAGYDVRTFPSSKAFLEAAPALTAGCVVLDLHQPGGLAVPRELKARRRIGLPVIALG